MFGILLTLLKLVLTGVKLSGQSALILANAAHVPQLVQPHNVLLN